MYTFIYVAIIYLPFFNIQNYKFELQSSVEPSLKNHGFQYSIR